MATIAELLARALEAHQAGRLQQAQEIYVRILQENPGHADAWHFLGMIAHQQGEHATAVEHMRKALSFNSANAAYHSNLGAAHAALGQPEEAAASYREALRVYPDFPEAHNNLGNTLKELGKLEEAVAHFREALRLKPAYCEAHNNLGTVLKEQGRQDDAVACCREALRLRPNYAPAHANLGSIFHDQGKLAEALACYRTAIRLQPDLVQAHYNLANILLDQEKPKEAIASYRQVVRLRPDCGDAHGNLGTALRKEGLQEEAVAACREAVRLRPENALLHSNLGAALTDRFQWEEAMVCLRQALALDPELAEAHCNLGNALKDQGRPGEAVACYREALRLKPDLTTAHTNLLFTLNLDPRAEPPAIYAEHRHWGESHGPWRPAPSHANPPDPERRLRVGYVSPDLRRHAVSRLFEPILVHHDPARIEAFCYAEVQTPDTTTARLQSLAKGWRFTRGLADAAVADMIRADGIDILVDLAGHTAGNRLRVFALKPAPVQVTYLGYPNTTGLSTIDYRLTDAILDPPGEPALHTEELVRLPGAAWCFAPPDGSLAVNPLPALRTGRLTFGSLNDLAKLNDEVIDLWSRVLQAVPSARLLLFRHTLRGTTREHLYRRFAARGVPGDRLEMRCDVGNRDYFITYHDIDVILDTFPWTGHVTSCESLWMGVPIVTLHGKRHAARMTSALLTRVGLTELSARSPEEFVARAARLAGALEYLAGVRARLRALLSASLCDGRSFTAALEDAYRTMWRRWCGRRE